jgi:curved DNA-binding protein CbpA
LTITMAIEVVLQPDLEESDNYYKVLGCPNSATIERLTKSYRDLSRKVGVTIVTRSDQQLIWNRSQIPLKKSLCWQYHPDANPNDPEALLIFHKVGEAYTTLCDPSAIIAGDEGTCERVQPTTPEHAKKVYEKKFEKYREKYYSEGAIFGLPYSYELREALERSKQIQGSLSFRLWKFRIHLFRTWLIKKELSCMILLCETVATWTVISCCK